MSKQTSDEQDKLNKKKQIAIASAYSRADIVRLLQNDADIPWWAARDRVDEIFESEDI